MLKKFQFILFLIIFSNCNFSFAEEKIIFVDIDYIYANTIAGKKINKQIQDKAKNINNEINEYNKKIQTEKGKLINQKNILAKEEFNKISQELNNKIKEYNKIISKKNNELLTLRNKAKIKFSEKLKDILQKYAENNSVELIINKKNILLGKNNLDATKDILEIFDKNIKEIKLK